MKYSKKLAAFMNERQKIINKLCGEDLRKYCFTEEDEQELRSLPEETAKRLYKRHITAVSAKWLAFPGIPTLFCTISDRQCRTCNYGNRHGMCWTAGSDYKHLLSQFEQKNIKVDVDAVYTEILEKMGKQRLLREEASRSTRRKKTINVDEKELAELKKIFGNEDVCRVCGKTNFSESLCEGSVQSYCKNCNVDDGLDIKYPSYVFRLHSIMDVMLFHDKSYTEALDIVRKNYERSKYREV